MQPLPGRPPNPKLIQWLSTFDIVAVLDRELHAYEDVSNTRMEGITALSIAEIVDRHLPQELWVAWASDQAYIKEWVDSKQIISFSAAEALSLWKKPYVMEKLYVTPSFLMHLASAYPLTNVQLHEVSKLLKKAGIALPHAIPTVIEASDAEIKETLMKVFKSMAKDHPKVAYRLFKEQLALSDRSPDMPYAKFLELMDNL